jgi:hypothetical protein
MPILMATLVSWSAGMRQIRTSGGSASPIIDSDIPDDVAKPASAISDVVARVTLL